MKTLNLSRFSDLDILRIVSREQPDFVEILALEMDKGRTDEQIIQLVCECGGSPQAMRYVQKCIRGLRELGQEGTP